MGAVATAAPANAEGISNSTRGQPQAATKGNPAPQSGVPFTIINNMSIGVKVIDDGTRYSGANWSDLWYTGPCDE
ncbi:hypothetical protein EF918_11205 [Streptomyces sp. WAC06614]|nr:hypothetical protein EF918_11205 [Streptomyces sp. WAC06614]